LLWWWYVSVPDVSGDFAFGAPAFGISAFFGIPAFGISAFGNSAFGDSAPLPVGVVLVVNYDPVAISLQGAESLESGIGRHWRYALIFLFSSLMTIQNQKRTQLFYRDCTPKLGPHRFLFSF
jgi:hypothetical protein